MRARLAALVLLIGLSAVPDAVEALGCTNPPGNAGDQIYNNAAGVNSMQFCNGTVWVNMGSTIGVGTLTNNDLCTTNGTNIICTVGNPLPLSYGGTNASLTASNGGIFYSTGSAGAILSGTSTADQILLSGASGAPAWSTATYPATTTANDLLYSSSANTIANLATANSSVLATNSSGVPSLSSVLPSAVQGNITTLGTVTVGTWQATPVAVAYGGTGANLSSTGGTSQVLQQTSAGAAITVGQLSCGSLSNGAASCSTNTTNASNITSGTLGSAELSGSYTGITGVGTITAGTWNGTTIAIANGGTSQTTAPLARGASGLNIDEMTIPSTNSGNTNYTILTTDRTVAVGTNALTAARTWTLPLGSQVNAGQEVCIVDKGGGVSTTNYLTIAGAGSDTVEPSTATTIKTQYGSNCYTSDGGTPAKWTSVGGGGGVPGGSSTDVQYNNSGALAGDSSFTYAGSGGTLYIAGNVGIGTTGPVTKLTVQPAALSSTPDGIEFQGTGNSINDIIEPIETSGGSGNMNLWLGANAYATNSAVSQFGSGADMAGIDVRSDNGQIQFFTGTTSVSEQMVINSSGLVGIGTAAPGALFTVGNNAFEVNAGGVVTTANGIGLGDLAQIATNTVLGNATSGTANVSAMSMSSCSAANDALTWTTNSGFTCNTSITAASATNATDVGVTVTSSNNTFYPMFVASSTNTNQAADVNGNFTINPSTGALGIIGALTSAQTSIGTAATNGLFLENTTAATASLQQYSPLLHFEGQGWKTNTTAASQPVDFTEQVQPVAGASNPSGNLVWSSSVNSGTVSPLMTLTSGGNVGIGTTSPAYKLDVSDGTVHWVVNPYTAGSIAYFGTNSNHALGFTADGAEYMRITTAGNVGIGTTNPNWTLDVRPAANENFAVTSNIGGATGSVAIGAANDANSALVPMEIRASSYDFSTGNVGIGTANPLTYALDVNGTLNVTGAVTCGSGCAAGPWTTSGTNIVPTTAGLSYNVGIGTTGPVTKLTIQPAALSSTPDGIEFQGTGNSINDIIEPIETSGGSGNMNLWLGANAYATNSAIPQFGSGADMAGIDVRSDNGQIQFFTGTTSVSEQMVINSSGLVGIGTAVPQNKLDIQGGNLSVNSGTTTGSYPSILELGGDTTGYDVFEATSSSLLTINKAGWTNVDIVGNVGIGYNSPSATLAVNGTASFGANGAQNGAWLSVVGGSSNGGIYASTADSGQIAVYGVTTTSSAYGLLGQNNSDYCYVGTSSAAITCNGPVPWSSDRRLKTDIVPLKPQEGLDALMNIQPVHYHWKGKSLNKDDPYEMGFIAQNVEKVLPDLISEVPQAPNAPLKLPGNKAKGLDYTRMTAPIVLAIQQLKHMFDGDHDALTKLKADNDNLRAELKAANDNEAADASAIEQLRRQIGELKPQIHAQ